MPLRSWSATKACTATATSVGSSSAEGAAHSGRFRWETPMSVFTQPGQRQDTPIDEPCERSDWWRPSVIPTTAHLLAE